MNFMSYELTHSGIGSPVRLEAQDVDHPLRRAADGVRPQAHRRRFDWGLALGLLTSVLVSAGGWAALGYVVRLLK